MTPIRDTKQEFRDAISNVCLAAMIASNRNGFWSLYDTIEGLPLTSTQKEEMLTSIRAQKVSLMHSELGELTEAQRKPGMCEKVPTITKEEEELADLAIRMFDYCGKMGIDLGNAILLKMDYNATRPYKHGKGF